MVAYSLVENLLTFIECKTKKVFSWDINHWVMVKELVCRSRVGQFDYNFPNSAKVKYYVVPLNGDRAFPIIDGAPSDCSMPSLLNWKNYRFEACDVYTHPSAWRILMDFRVNYPDELINVDLQPASRVVQHHSKNYQRDN